MRIPVAVFAGMVVAAAAVARASPQDEAAVRTLVSDYVHAREARDPARVSALFTADADQLVSSGEWRRGRDQVVSGSMASTERTGGSREIVVERVRFVADGVAIVDGRYTIHGVQGGDRRMWSTFVMTRTPAGWRIAAIRNMLPAAPAAAAR